MSQLTIVLLFSALLENPPCILFGKVHHLYTSRSLALHSALPSGQWCVSQRPPSAINGQVKTAWLTMVPDPSEMSRTSVVRSILDISDGSGKDQPRAVKMVSADLRSASVQLRKSVH